MQPKLVGIDRIHPHAGFPRGEHRHDYWELIAVLAGTYRVRLHAAMHAHRAPTMVVYPPGVVHEPIHSGSLDLLFYRLAWHDRPPSAAGADGTIVVADPQARLLSAVGWLYDCVHDPASGGTKAAAADRRTLLRLIARAIRRQTAGDKPTVDEPVARIHDYIRHGAQLQFGIDILARLAGLSPSQLRRRFKARYGISPMAYARQVRLERALTLLTTTGMPLEDVAKAIGIRSPNYFTHFITRMSGRPPLAWRTDVRG